MTLGWTAASEARLAKLWATSASASEIAGEIGGGISRCAVIGKARRMKLAARAESISPAELERRRELRRIADNARREYRRENTRYAAMIGRLEKPKMEPEKNKPKAVEMFIGSLNIPFNDLRNFSGIDGNQCRFIDGDAAPFLSCGNETEPGRSYCGFHHGIVYGGKREPPHISEAERNRRKAQGCALGRHQGTPASVRCIAITSSI